jgi:hypothetical protein
MRIEFSCPRKPLFERRDERKLAEKKDDYEKDRFDNDGEFDDFDDNESVKPKTSTS